MSDPQTAAPKYANDGSLESVEAMLAQMAATFYPRVLAMGLPMEFEDILQELRMAYVKARAKWNPEKARFTTYCYTVARNEFNRRIERMALDRKHLGLASVDNLSSGEGEDDGVGDGYERYLGEAAEDLSPEERLVARETMADNLRRLSPHSRAVVRQLLANEGNRNGQTMTLREIALHLGLAIPQMQAIQHELNEVFGVQVTITRAKLRAA